MNTQQNEKDIKKKGYKINPSRDIEYPVRDKKEKTEEVSPDLGGDQTRTSGPVKR